MTSRGLLSLLVALLVASPAAAASEEGGLKDFLLEAGNLLLLLAVLFYVGRKPVLNFLSERRERIQQSLTGSEQLLKNAEARLAEWTERTTRLDGEVEELQRTARERAEQERAQILEEARVSAERIRRDAASAVDREIERARVALREEAADLAIEMAGALLREQLTDEDRRRLVDEFVSEIEAGGAQASPAASPRGSH